MALCLAGVNPPTPQAQAAPSRPAAQAAATGQEPAEPGAREADAYYQFLLGRRLESAGDIENAIKAFQEAVALTDEGMNLVTRARFSLLSNCYSE